MSTVPSPFDETTRRSGSARSDPSKGHTYQETDLRAPRPPQLKRGIIAEDLLGDHMEDEVLIMDGAVGVNLNLADPLVDLLGLGLLVDAREDVAETVPVDSLSRTLKAS